jgi:hypothetical protein
LGYDAYLRVHAAVSSLLLFSISDRIGSAPFDFLGPFQPSPASLGEILLASELEIEPGAGATWEGPLANAVAELPSGAGNVLYLGGTADASGVCPVDLSPAALTAPRFTLNGDKNVPPPGGGDGFTDGQMARLGPSAFMSIHAVDEWTTKAKSPTDPTQGCVPAAVISEAGGNTRTSWPWVRVNSNCGATTAWSVNQPIIWAGGAGVKPYGFDGPTLYVDPFDLDTNGLGRAYVTGGVVKGATGSNFQPIMTSGDGGANWTSNPLADRARWWHPAMTSSPSHGVNVDSHGTLFYASCEGAQLNVYWSYDRAGSAMNGPVTLPSPCSGPGAIASVALSRVHPTGNWHDDVRVAYVTPVGGRLALAVGVVTVPTKLFWPGPTAAVMADYSPVMPSDPAASVLRVWSVDPDPWDWNLTHPGVFVPDTAPILWDEGDMTCPTPSGNGAVRYIMLHGTGKTQATATAPQVLAQYPAIPNCSGSSFSKGGADFYTSSFYFQQNGTDHRLNYFVTWPQNDGATPLPVRQHYNVISVSPFRTSLAALKLEILAAAVNTYSLTVHLGSTGPTAWEQADVRFMYQHKNGDWRKVEAGCAHPTVTVDSSGTGATYSCVMHNGADARRFIVLATSAEALGDAPSPSPSPSTCPADLRVFCHADALAETDLGCVAPPLGQGQQTICVPRGTGGSCEQEASACVTDGECCSGLTCQSGACAPQSPICQPDRGACAIDGDCCTGLTCQGGACAQPPACQPAGGRCSSSADCCGGLTCPSRACQ